MQENNRANNEANFSLKHFVAYQVVQIQKAQKSNFRRRLFQTLEAREPLSFYILRWEFIAILLAHYYSEEKNTLYLLLYYQQHSDLQVEW